MSIGVGKYYDRLGRWNGVARVFGYGGGRGTLTVHRALADPSAHGRPTFTRLHDVLLEHLPLLDTPRVLDAGCGLGGTMFALAEASGATCVGLTLSRSQAEAANAAATRLALHSRVKAIVQGYDHPPSGPFDLVVAIESLAHSADPATSVAALAAVLAPGGRLVVIDDMPEPAAAASEDLITFKAGWQCPVLWSASAYQAAFARAGLSDVTQLDLTAGCRPRSQARAGQLMMINRFVHRLVPAGLQQVMDSHMGGLALERLTRAGLVRYRLLIARRADLQVS